VNIERMRTALIVSLVSVLVWLFAESRTLRIETIAVPVTIDVGGRTLVFRLTDGDAWAGVVEVELTGPVGLIDALRGPMGEGVLLELGDELPGDPGVRSVDLREALRRDSLFADSGITIRRIVPETLGLEIDRLESVRLPVQVDLSGVETSGPVTVQPPEIEVRVPASFAGGLPESIIARLDPTRLASLVPGRRSELSQVPVELEGLPDGLWGLRLGETRVTVALAVRARTQNLMIAELPILIELAPADFARWIVEIPPEDRVLTNLSLTGPGAAIDRLRRGEIRLRAVVSISSEAMERGIDRAPVELVGLPSGVVAEFAGREVRVTVRRRETPPTDPSNTPGSTPPTTTTPPSTTPPTQPG
jgi:hypothetical protein